MSIKFSKFHEICAKGESIDFSLKNISSEKVFSFCFWEIKLKINFQILILGNSVIFTYYFTKLDKKQVEQDP